MDLGQALERSCNVFFYEMGERLGIERIRQYALRYGFGRTLGIELPGEAEGFLPSKERPTPNPKDFHAWTKGYDRNVGIGQGNLRVTPLQMAALLAAVAGDGRPVIPHLVDGEVTSGGQPLSARTLSPIRDGLRRVVMGERGTARNVESLRRTLAAGKTGTAQAGELNEAWFAGFAPAMDPQVVAVAVIEKVAAGGGTAAGPVVAAVFEAYLGRD
jgi:penicillin-binding protein 2